MSRGTDDYRYGHSELAGDRLRLLATIFEPTTRRFIGHCAPDRVASALDLGCGPGYTTALLAHVTRATRTIGVEFSAEFVERATRENASDSISFVQHDVSEVPLPDAPADVIFARYLLAHLPSPHAVVEAWASQLAPGGRLLLEEVERIDSAQPTFARYLELTAAMLTASGTELYVGGLLGSATWPSIEIVHNETAPLSPTTSDVATMFGMNLQTWRHDAWVVENVEQDELNHIASALDSLRSSEATGEVTWHMRHLALQPVGA